MKKIIILSLTMALGFGAFTANANDNQVPVVKEKKNQSPPFRGRR
ncbi:hypothetical protein [Pedobacter sp. NJ-S-72]